MQRASKNINIFKKTIPIEQQKEISELQELLIGNNKSNKKFDNYTMKRAFDYSFGDKIDNIKFISYIKEGISILYLNDKIDDYNNEVFKYFKKIREYTQDFLYIPMLKENTLHQLKKYLYLSVISNQLKLCDYQLLPNYILYNESFFNESPFKEFQVDIENERILLNHFPKYKEFMRIKINFDLINDYIFSQPIQEAYFQTCREVFGQGAKFVTMNNIKLATKYIYEYIIKKNLKFVKLEPNYLGITLYNKKILITNSFLSNIYSSPNERKKITLIATLIMTILHEISHCLVNILPTYDKDYLILSNPFIRTFKKNVAVLDFIKGDIIYEGEKNVFGILNEKIKDYKFIEDSGSYFENKVFNNSEHYNYISSIYFLDKENLKCSLKEFNSKFENFKQAFEANEISSLNNGASFTCKRSGGYFYYGGCYLNPNGMFVME